MSEELLEIEENEVAPTSLDEVVGEYPEIARKYKAGEELTDEELDTVADVALSVIRNILMPKIPLSMSMRAMTAS